MIADVVIKLVLAGSFLGMVLNLAGLLTWVERKQSAVMQDRIGANRAFIFLPDWIIFKPFNWILGFIGRLGLFHSLADAMKMFLKEDFIPEGADKLLHTLAPMMSVVFALLAFS